EQVAVIFAGVRGYLDALKLEDVKRFETSLLSELHAGSKAILDAIRADRELKPETEAKLKALLDDFVKNFA
ncbi:MAG TPA: F0F1 ATP synthase subunit alpha, partial [Thermoanaerobaculia bacterium]|nr:F0F1 ATP synthase subunit alpha [Thermoanaerobaculia bacterium]